MSGLHRLDSRGRITIASAIRKNGIEPSALWTISFGPNGTVILTPATVVSQGGGS